jgi:two-component system LytT family response regulator
MRVLVVDDEHAARRKVLRFLQEHADIDVIGEASTGTEAIDRIAADRPDLVFLDIQMPDADGFEVVEAIAEGQHVPSIVFATAHDEYAVRAFEVNALDYLLKPFDRERFDRALERARQTLSSAQRSPQQRLLALLDTMRPANRYVRRLLLPFEGRSLFVNVAEIVRIEADRNNAEIFTRRGSFMLRTTLEALEDKLDPEQFVRIHRSHIVNLDAVKEIHPWFRGDYKAKLHDGTELMWSRRYASQRPELLK